MRATHTISDNISLQRVLWLQRGTRVSLALPAFSIVQQENLELRFNRCLSFSGTEFCTLGFIASLVACILFDAAHWPDFIGHALKLTFTNLLVCLIAAAFGKAFGIARARFHLARLIWAVAERLEEDHPERGGTSSPRAGRCTMNNRRASA